MKPIEKDTTGAFSMVYDLGWRDGRLAGVKQLVAFLSLMGGKTIGKKELSSAVKEMLGIWKDEVNGKTAV